MIHEGARRLHPCTARRALVVPMMVALVLLLSSASYAIPPTKTWSATPGSGNWSAAANWVGGVAPVAGDTLVFPASSTTKAMTNDLAAAFDIVSLTFDGNGYTVSGNSITLGSGISCTTSAAPQTNTVSLPIILGATITANITAGCDFFLNGIISGGFGITKTGSGVLELGGANTFSGIVTVNTGLLVANHNQALGSGDGTAGTGTNVTQGASLDVYTSNIANEALSITGIGNGSNGALYNATTAIWGGPITLTGDAQIGAANGTFTLNGTISGPGLLAKVSTATLVLTGTETYTNQTIVSGGTLLVNGALPALSSVTVYSGATLGGVGTIPSQILGVSGGSIAPGQSPGTLNTGTATFNSGSTFKVELNGATAGTQYDRLNVTGDVVLGGSTLSATLGYSPTPGTSFIIIANDGADAVTGTFAGLAEGASTVVNGTTMTISYKGGDGNDVVLTVAAGVPTLDPMAMVLLGGLLMLLAARRLAAAKMV